MVFGAGRRVCLGESLAKNRLFLFSASLLQNFSFHPEIEDTLPDFDPRLFNLGIVLHPGRVKIKAITRNTVKSEVMHGSWCLWSLGFCEFNSRPVCLNTAYIKFGTGSWTWSRKFMYSLFMLLCHNSFFGNMCLMKKKKTTFKYGRLYISLCLRLCDSE